MNLITAARPYAKAIIDLARSSNDFAQWSKILEFLNLAVSNQHVKGFLANQAESGTAKAELLFKLDPGILGVQGKNLVKILAANNRLLLIPELYAMYEKLRKQEQKQVSINLTTASEIAATDLDILQDIFAAKIPGAITLEHAIDAKLIGGGKIKLGDRVIDSSIKGRLSDLSKHLTK